MGVSKSKQSGSETTFRLPADCNVRTISPAVSEARDRMAAREGIALDGSAVETADVTFVQFVVSARKLCESNAAPFELKNPSEAALAAFARAGIPARSFSPIPGAR